MKIKVLIFAIILFATLAACWAIGQIRYTGPTEPLPHSPGFNPLKYTGPTTPLPRSPGINPLKYDSGATYHKPANSGMYPFTLKTEFNRHPVKLVEICPTTIVAPNATITAVPLGRYIDVGDNPVFESGITQDPANDHLWVYIETSADNGNTWYAITALDVPGRSYQVIPISTVCGSTAGIIGPILPDQVGGVVANGIAQGPMGNKFRVVFGAVNQLSPNPWQATVKVFPGQHFSFLDPKRDSRHFNMRSLSR